MSVHLAQLAKEPEHGTAKCGNTLTLRQTSIQKWLGNVSTIYEVEWVTRMQKEKQGLAISYLCIGHCQHNV